MPWKAGNEASIAWMVKMASTPTLQRALDCLRVVVHGPLAHSFPQNLTNCTDTACSWDRLVGRVARHEDEQKLSRSKWVGRGRALPCRALDCQSRLKIFLQSVQLAFMHAHAEWDPCQPKEIIMETVRECPSKIPWDKGKIVGQKLPISSRTSGPSGFGCTSPPGRECSRYLIWARTGNQK